jgi:hypothetical protein
MYLEDFAIKIKLDSDFSLLSFILEETCGRKSVTMDKPYPVCF